MPRRRNPPKRWATASFGPQEKKRRVLWEKIVDALNAYGDAVVMRLSPKAREQLVADLFDAACFALAGRPALGTSREKPEASNMDTFVKDVCDAMRGAGLPVLMDPNPDASLAQSLARKLAEVIGLPDRGDLFHQMQRARRLVKTPMPIRSSPRRK